MRLLLTLLLLSVPLSAYAVDGVIEINQASAEAAGFPFQINTRGSYRLTSDLVPPADTGGIRINASNVLLDLNGFTVRITGTATRNAITDNAGGTVRNIVIRNGTITNTTPGSGIVLDESEGSTIEDVRVELTAATATAGIKLGADDPASTGSWLTRNTVSRCKVNAVDLTESFVAVGESSEVSGCTLTGGALHGILVGDGSRVENNRVDGADNGIRIVDAGSPDSAVQIKGNIVSGAGTAAGTIGIGASTGAFTALLANNEVLSFRDCVTGVTGVLRDNVLRGCVNGIRDGAARSQISNNTIELSGSIPVFGILTCENTLVTGNVIRALPLGFASSVAVNVEEQCIIRDNQLSGKTAISVTTAYAVIDKNYLAYEPEDGSGVVILGGSSNVVLTGNRFAFASSASPATAADDISTIGGAPTILTSASAPNFHIDDTVAP